MTIKKINNNHYWWWWFKDIFIIVLISLLWVLLWFWFALYKKVNLLKEKVYLIEKNNIKIDDKIAKIKEYEKKVNDLFNKKVKNIIDFNVNKKEKKENYNRMNFVIFSKTTSKDKYINIIKKSKLSKYKQNILIRDLKLDNNWLLSIKIYTKDTYKNLILSWNFNKNIYIDNTNNILFKNIKKIYYLSWSKIILNNNYNWGIIKKIKYLDKNKFKQDLSNIKYYSDLKRINLLINNLYYEYFNIDILKVFYIENDKILTDTQKKNIFLINWKNIPLINDELKDKILEKIKYYKF